jgi:protocatechuate 3,4-dioxygenase beta subunit
VTLMPDLDESNLTEQVVASFDTTPDPRLKFLMTELVRSLHNFVRRTELTFEEWNQSIEFLTRTGQKCTSTRQEFILLSDVLGVSMLVDAVNHREREGATETTVLGPFYVGEHKPLPNGSDIAHGVDGEPLFVSCSVTDLSGKPVQDARIDVWHADDEGCYDSQKPDYASHGPTLRARFASGEDGGFFFRSILPCSYPIPTDGPVGELIRASGRQAMRPAHIHFLVEASGFDPLITHVFIDGDDYLHSDVVFGVKDELIATVERRTDPVLPDSTPISIAWHHMRYDFRLRPGTRVAPRPMMAAAE